MLSLKHSTAKRQIPETRQDVGLQFTGLQFTQEIERLLRCCVGAILKQFGNKFSISIVLWKRVNHRDEEWKWHSKAGRDRFWARVSDELCSSGSLSSQSGEFSKYRQVEGEKLKTSCVPCSQQFEVPTNSALLIYHRSFLLDPKQ